MNKKSVSRRDFLKVGGAGVAGLAGLAGLRSMGGAETAVSQAQPASSHGMQEHVAGAVGEVDFAANGFDPYEILYDFDYGEVTE
jgi:anaerobic selenocysteine-containing dehydrogenase